MSRVSQLYAVQEVDLELAEQRAALEQVEDQMQPSEELAARRARLATDRAHLAALEAEQRDLEIQVREQREHVASVEAKLYGGTVTNPRELVALQDDLAQLQSALGRVEDRLLEVMSEAEPLHVSVQTQTAELAAAEQAWQALQARLSQDHARLTASIAALSERRAAVVAGVDPRDLVLYQMLAHMKQGKALARMERGTCLGCRINQPLSMVQRVRGGNDLVQCASCQRILYAG